MRRAAALQLSTPRWHNARGRVLFTLALSAFGSATAICTAFGLALMANNLAPTALSTALVGCVGLSAGSLAAGWWAIDRLAPHARS